MRLDSITGANNNLQGEKSTLQKQIESNRAEIRRILNDKNAFNWQVLPNPYAIETKITYTLNERKIVLIEVLNATGQVVVTLAKGEQKSGSHELILSAKKAGYSAGVYTLKMIIGEDMYTTKLVETE